jgi:peptidoglycan hydrolase CwlO-like protein
VLTSALVFTGPAVEGTAFSGYINSGLEKVYAKTQKQKDAEKKKSQAEKNLKDKKNEINGLKDQQQTTADDIKNKSAKLDEILAAQKKLQTDITSKQAEIEQNQKDLAAAQEKQQEQYDAMKKRIQFMYENSAEDNIWTAIIESNGITDMLNRIEYVSDVYDSDRALMDSYQAAVEQVKEIGTKLDNDMNELTAMQDDYEKQQADVEAAIVALENQKEQYASQIAQAQQQADNYQNIITAQGKIIQEQEAAAALQPQPLPERTAHQAVQAMMVVEPVRAEVLPVTMQQAVERTRVLQQEFQEAL